MIETKFKIDELVGWTDASGTRNTGRIIEYTYDPITITTNYLVKNDRGGYSKVYEQDMERLNKGV